jgi:hypothetical protein
MLIFFLKEKKDMKNGRKKRDSRQRVYMEGTVVWAANFKPLYILQLFLNGIFPIPSPQ